MFYFEAAIRVECTQTGAKLLLLAPEWSQLNYINTLPLSIGLSNNIGITIINNNKLKNIFSFLLKGSLLLWMLCCLSVAASLRVQYLGIFETLIK
jgi:hypothetical protein